jgi:octaprenyl-diphosphate synthase
MLSPKGDFLERLQGDIDKVNHHLMENLRSHIPLIAEINQHILSSGGKRLRSLLFVVCARLCGYEGERAYTLSSIFEYLHAATLLHDDVIDKAHTRRGKPAANTVWGNSAAVLVGDFLLSKSFTLAVESRKLRLLEVLSGTTTQMAEGMVLELIHTDDLAVDEETYRRILINKTAILISAACQTGAIWGGAPEKEEQVLGNYGLDLGIAFQMVDDLLDYTASEEETGKTVANDFKEGKITLPLIHALRSCSAEEQKRIQTLAKKNAPDQGELMLVFELVQKYGGLQYTRERAESYKNRAVKALEIFPTGPDRKVLEDLAEYVIERRR